MKTKIIYISGNEIFDMADIRAAFEEVRNTLNLDKNTVLFGVPVDNDDAGLVKSETPHVAIAQEPIVQPDMVEQEFIETIEDVASQDIAPEPVVKETVKKRGRKPKEKTEPVIADSEQIAETPDTTDATDVADDKIVPILSVLSSKENSDIVEDYDKDVEETVDSETDDGEIEIIEDIVQEPENNPESVDADYENSVDVKESDEDKEHDLERLLSAMKPLQEDILENATGAAVDDTDTNADEDNIDATLEQLATEFVQTQDKIASESKSSGRGRIGKLRNILPFKQSKHKDQGLGDLFGWAGVAANDEDFSVPGFFTNASSKK